MKKLLFILIFFGVINIFAQDTNTVSLDECLQFSVENFEINNLRENNNQATDLQKQNLKTNFYPVVKLEGQATYQSTSLELDLPMPGVEFPTVPLDQYKAYLQINQLIYDGGMTKSYSSLLDLNVQENSSNSAIQQLEIENNVAKIFFLSLLLEKQTRIVENQLDVLNNQLKIIESGIKNHILTPINRDILLSEILKNEQNLDEIISIKQANLKILEQFTGQVFSDNTILIFPEININLIDTTQSPNIDLLEIQTQKIFVLDKQISASRKPKVFAFGQGGYGRPGLNMLSDEFNPYFIVGVKFSWQIYDWNNAKRNRQINEIRVQSIDINKKNIQLNISSQKENILAQIESKNISITKDKQIIELQNKILKTYNSQLKNGIISSSEYIIQVNKVAQAELMLELHKIQLTQLKFQYNNIY